MSKTQSQSQTSTMDPRSTAYRDWGYRLAQNAFGAPYQAYGGQLTAGMDPMYQRAVQQGMAGYGGVAQNLGLNMQKMQDMVNNPQTFTGSTLTNYQSPYTGAVTDAARAEFDRARQSGLTSLNTSFGDAFGRNSRQNVAQGSLMADLATQQASTIAGIQQQGFQDAYGRWAADRANQQGLTGNMINLGLGGLQAQTDLGMQAGDYARNIAQQDLNAKYQQFVEGRDWQRNQAMGAAQAGAPWLSYADRTDTMSRKIPLGQSIAGIGLMAGGALTGNPMLMGAGANTAFGTNMPMQPGQQGQQRGGGGYFQPQPWNFPSSMNPQMPQPPMQWGGQGGGYGQYGSNLGLSGSAFNRPAPYNPWRMQMGVTY